MPVFNFVGIVVRSIEESLAFYRLLGVEVGQSDGGPHHQVALPNGMNLAWDTVALMRELDGEWHEPTGHRMGLGFQCESPAEVDRVYAEVTGAGYTGKKAPWDAFWGQRYAQLTDPDGNTVDLFATLPA